MRKNLFLTLALSLAAFVGINAQDWSITLAGQNGLPGQSVKKEGVSTYHYTSGIIKTGEAIKSLRFTVTATYNNAKAEGSDFPFFALGELSIKKVNGEKISYTAKTNACHNTLSGGQDGDGLAALSDGKYNNYFHSVWNKEAAAKVKEYHYIEMELNASVDEFIIEWYGRPTNINNTPTTVVLTKGGVKGVPYSDRSFTHGAKITDIATLANTQYITMLGNAATIYNEYTHANNGELKPENTGLKGSGPMYAIYGGNVAKEADVSLVTELVPVEGKENTYNLYFPTQKTWLSKNGTDNNFNKAQNGAQGATKNRVNAAEVTLTPVGNGDFEMSYIVDSEYYDGVVYIGADPRSGNMKTLSAARKVVLERNGWCEGFGIKCAFNWTFYKAEYTGAAWVSFFELTRLHFDAMAIKAEFGEGESIDEAITTLEGAIAENPNDAEAEEYIMMAKEMISGYLYEIFAAIWENYSTEFSTKYYALCSETPKAGYYSLSAYNTYLQKNIIDALENILTADDAVTNLYDSLSALRNVLNNVDKNIEEFLKSKIELTVFPATFETPANWEQSIVLDKEIEGFRLTILEAVGNYQGYPFTSFSELEIYDNENKKLALDTVLVKTNSVQNGDGQGLLGALDGKDDTYYHSAYTGDSKFDPIGYVYFDITFPENKKHSIFTVKIKQRQDYSRPRRVALSQYGQTVDPKEMRENKYNVVMGAQVTDVANLKDGGLYIISGNLNVNAPDNKAVPQYYSGNEPYSPSAIAAANDPCVYMFKKVGDGWNIISLYAGKYWAKPNKTNDSEAVGMTPIQNDAAVVKFANSTNEKFENTIVIYSDINEALKASWEGKEYGVEEGDNTISISEADVVAKALVYMDWGAGYNLYTRPCVSCQPGDFTHGKDKLSDELISKSAAGDYLHFNKTNGEGEWNIYEAEMDGEYYVWLQGLINSIDETRLEAGNNPGCVVTDEATINAFAKSKADANTIITNEKMDEAQATVEALISVLNKLGDAETVGINADYEYRINSDISNFLKNSGKTRSIYVNDFSGNATLKWGETPEGSYGYEYIFKFEPQTLTAAQIEEFKLSEEDAKNVYLISCSKEDEVKYFGDKDDSNNVTLTNNARFATPYVVKSIQGTSFTIYNAKISNGARELHAEGHGNGAGTEGRIIYYNVGSINNASAWNIIIVNENEKNAIEEIIAEGDEVVSVTIYTTSGSVIPTLEKGINIVVKVYANGAIETQKVLVK